MNRKSYKETSRKRRNLKKIYPTTPVEVESYLKTINIRKSVGPFSIKNRVLKEFNKVFAVPISHIFNVSLDSGVFPKKMKIASCTSVQKR